MPRTFKYITQNDLEIKINQEVQSNRFNWPFYHNIVSKDLKKVEFDCENCIADNSDTIQSYRNIMGYQTINNFTFLGCAAGGDWEYPVYFIIYWDGSSLRGYIPKNGNPWNTDTKSAYGNEDDDIKNVIKRIRKKELFINCDFDDNDLEEMDPNELDLEDHNLIINDIKNRFNI